MNKIQALEKTIYNLENDVYRYNWGCSDSCNCGVLAKSIIDAKHSVFQLGYRCSPYSELGSGVFSRDYESCRKTGLELPTIFKGLYDVGFTYDELLNLEYLEDERILSKAGYSRFSIAHYDKAHLIKYLKAWVAILKEQEVKEPEPVHQPERTRIVYVSVPETIKEQAEQLISN